MSTHGGDWGYKVYMQRWPEKCKCRKRLSWIRLSNGNWCSSLNMSSSLPDYSFSSWWCGAIMMKDSPCWWYMLMHLCMDWGSGLYQKERFLVQDIFQATDWHYILSWGTYCVLSYPSLWPVFRSHATPYCNWQHKHFWHFHFACCTTGLQSHPYVHSQCPPQTGP